VAGAALSLALVLVIGTPATADSPLRWQRASLPARGLAVTAVAADPPSGRLAAGDEGGVWLRGPGRSWRRAARLEAVADLAFAADGALWIASVVGLWRLGPDGRLEERTPAAGESARRAARVATRGAFVAVATEAGAFASRGGRRFARVPQTLSGRPVAALALGSGPPGGADLWLAAGPELWRARLVEDGAAASVEAVSVRRLGAVTGVPLGEAPVDLQVLSGGRAAALYGRHLAVWDPGRGAWRVSRPDLPPGARARRLRAEPGGAWWIAHDRGLSRAPGPDGPWRRAADPAGRLPARGLARLGARLFAASQGALLAGAPDERPTPAAPAAEPPVARTGARPSDASPPGAGPPVRAVHVAALRHLRLEPERLRSRFRGLRRRGWVPTLSLDLDAAEEHRSGWDDDEAFISGGMRFLRDRDRQHTRDLGARLELSWDLPALAYDSDWDDLSREARQVIALRDDVLDEINQLYFERRRALRRLRALSADDPEAAELRSRAAELAAGLDAWTGGWFSARLTATSAEERR